MRTLIRTPALTLIAILTIALGVGANTAIFSVVNGVLLRPLPFRDAQQIVQVNTIGKAMDVGGHSAAEFLDVQRGNHSLSAMAGYREALIAIAARPGEPEQVEGSYVTVDFFDVLGTPASLGRTFTRAHDAQAPRRLVVLSHDLWHRSFAGARDVVGRSVSIDGQPSIVAGVMPPGFHWPAQSQLWLLSRAAVPPSPIDNADDTNSRDVQYFDAIARVKAGVTMAQAQSDLTSVAANIVRAHQANDLRGLRLTPIRQQLVGDVWLPLLLLQGAVAVVLLIACANVSSLLIARAVGRRRELAIRAALGATRGDLIRQLLGEGLLIGGAGGVAALLLGSWSIRLLAAVVPEGLPRAAEIGLDPIVTTVTLAVALLAGAMSGLLPAWQGSRADAASALKQSGDRANAVRVRGRAALVVAEVSLTLVLLVAAGLLANSLFRLRNVDSGLRTEHVTVAALALPASRYAVGVRQVDLYRRLLAGLGAHPELRAVGVGFPGPLKGTDARGSFDIEGRSAGGTPPFAYIGSVSGGYFAAMGIPLVAGRTFTDRDTADAPPVAMVSLALARKYWPGQTALGKRVRFDDGPNVPWITIVGLTGDVRQLGLRHPPAPLLYVPYQQLPLPFTDVVVRSAAPAGAVASVLRSQLGSLDPNLPFGDIETLQHVIDRSLDATSFRTLLFGAFAVLALTLAAVGVYGLTNYSVAQRTREIGIRVALGAQPRQVLGSMIREGVGLACIGVALGVAGALAVTRLLGSLLFGVGATDPLTFAAVAGLLLAVALLASYIPSRRALRVDPLTALRAE